MTRVYYNLFHGNFFVRIFQVCTNTSLGIIFIFISSQHHIVKRLYLYDVCVYSQYIYKILNASTSMIWFLHNIFIQIVKYVPYNILFSFFVFAWYIFVYISIILDVVIHLIFTCINKVAFIYLFLFFSFGNIYLFFSLVWAMDCKILWAI